MSLKLIPVESDAQDGRGKKQKHFNPGNQIKKNGGRQNGGWRKGGALKHICLRLVRFINRGSRFTYEQIDDLIMALHHSILSLQKQKQEMLRKKGKK